MLFRRTLLSAASATLAASVLAPVAGAAGGPRTIRIGYQRYGTLILLKHTGLLEKALQGSNVSVSWSEFAAGPQLLQAIGAGAVDFGITGDAPPVFAQATSNRVVYVGHEPEAPFGEAIIVPASSPITDVAGLRGKQVALNRASNVHWLLLAALTKAGLTINDIKPVFLVPGAARPAFDSGRIDAWAIWDPYLSAVQEARPTRVLAQAGGLVGNRQFFLAERDFATRNPDLVRVLLAQIAAADSWSEAHKAEASQYLATDPGLPLPVVRKALDRLTYGVQPMTPDVVAEQQRIADAFLAQGLIPAKITVADAVWKPS